MKQQKEIKKSVPFTTAQKIIKYLEINLTKEVKGLYSENTDERNARQHKQMERYYMLMDRKNKYC